MAAANVGPSAGTSLPYRPCVGIMLINGEGKVFVGWRKEFARRAPDGYNWQMPQGGIDPGEAPLTAALRELHEETNVTSVRVVAESGHWLNYDLPETTVGRALKGRYGGQTQKWFVMAFEGKDDEIDVLSPGGGDHRAEFSDWKWAELDELVELIVPFKRAVYEALVEEFAPVVRPLAEQRRE